MASRAQAHTGESQGGGHPFPFVLSTQMDIRMHIANLFLISKCQF